MKLNFCSRESKLIVDNLDFKFITLIVNVYLVVVNKVHWSYISQYYLQIYLLRIEKNQMLGSVLCFILFDMYFEFFQQKSVKGGIC